MDDLNHIQFSQGMIAALFRNSLIETGEAVRTVQMPAAAPSVNEIPAVGPPMPPPTDPWKYLGQNQKNILIVLEYADAVFLPDDELSFLTNMLTACKLSLADVAIVNRNNNPQAGYTEWMQRLKSKTVLMFGTGPESLDLPITFPQFQVQAFSGTTFLHAPSLGECRDDGLLKSKLWVCLRRIFGI